MDDYDRIEIVYIFDEEPSISAFESLFEEFPTYPGPEYSTDEFSMSYRDENQGVNEVYDFGKYDDVIQVISTYPNWSISVPLAHDELTVVSNQGGVGLLSESPHFLEFTTWIYGLEDTEDEEHRNRVEQRRQEFVEVLAQAADILEPTWGFGRRGGLAIGEDETIEDLATRTKPPLYEYNVFREETVEAIGRERVLSAPAYYVEELDWGGVFMAVTEPPRQCGHEDQPCDEVAEHLGLPLANTERYH